MDSTRFKVLLSVAILIAGLLLTVVALSTTSTETSSGVVLDFGEGDTLYSNIGSDDGLDPMSALEKACYTAGLELEVTGGTVTKIGSVSNSSTHHWSFFVVEKGDKKWISTEPSDSISIDDYTITCWGYCDDGSVPSPAVDVTGYPIYGYSTPKRVISIAPSCTETVCAAGGTDLIVATDIYSNYPEVIRDGRASGDIASVGGFTNPSYESVLKNDPDLVVCIGSQNSHLQMAEKLRSHGVNVLVMSGGDDIGTVMDNLFMAGVVLGTQSETNKGISMLESQISQVEGLVEDSYSTWDKKVMVSLSAIKSPWVSGSDTFIDDVMQGIKAVNIYSSESGWVQINSETILKYDPEYIIIVSSDYSATQNDYDSMMASLSSEWRGTTAYKSGNIFLVTGDACDMMSRPGPRVSQITELLARIIQGDAFDDGIEVPKFIGNEYEDYLTISKEGLI